MGGKTGMMIGMVVIAVLAPYAAGAWATALGGVQAATVAGAAGAVTVSTTGVSALVSTLATISQISLGASLMGGLALGTAVTGGFDAPEYDYGGTSDYSFYEPSTEPSYEYTGFEGDYQLEGLDPDFIAAGQEVAGFADTGFKTLEIAGSPDTEVPALFGVPEFDPFGTEEVGQIQPSAGDSTSSFAEFGQLGAQEDQLGQQEEDEFSGSLV
jgi:hypothetical protein